MRKLILMAAALPMITIAAPSTAQNYPNYQNQYGSQGNSNMAARIDQLRVRLQTGMQNQTISRREAAPLRAQIRQLSRLERQYRVDGLSGQERADLHQRIRAVRQQLRAADNGANGRYAQWDAEDGYAPGYQQYPQGYGQGYQQHYPQGYQQPVQQTGIAGVLSQILGVGGLQVGQRAPANLYAVPYQYQNQYRDGYGVYYRSDGRRIYQIDARNQTVVRVLPM